MAAAAVADYTRERKNEFDVEKQDAKKLSKQKLRLAFGEMLYDKRGQNLPSTHVISKKTFTVLKFSSFLKS